MRLLLLIMVLAEHALKHFAKLISDGLRIYHLYLVAIEEQPLIEFVVLLHPQLDMIGFVRDKPLRWMNWFGRDIHKLFGVTFDNNILNRVIILASNTNYVMKIVANLLIRKRSL